MFLSLSLLAHKALYIRDHGTITVEENQNMGSLGNRLSYPPFICQYSKISMKLVDSEENAKECELPLIDLRGLFGEDKKEKMKCRKKIVDAASKWGFFQVLNHGISHELLCKMREEQVKIFELPFERKADGKLLNGSYRWGAPSATSVEQFSWSEAFHISLQKVPQNNCYGEELQSLRMVMAEFAAEMSELAMTLAAELAENLGQSKQYFTEHCNENTCFLRLNRYPPCPVSSKVFGLMPHTDSDFLTILHQDEVGGLQLMKDSKWISVKPNPDALIVNIGDLFQAWSNGAYKSVEHKVMTNQRKERFSIAYFLCPSYESVIRSSKDPPLYKQFTFQEFREQTQRDVQTVGRKIGLPRFLL
ncbi:gibberellin 2-beta-dioxygenase 8-like isoform X1 [Nymphaea colorata]|nr:gibberellin 2-beta-dioxygenase 8-like isoform X1 [Nymphaea colorata]